MKAYDIAVGFAGNPLDRLSQRRADASRLAELAARPTPAPAVFVQAMPVLRGGGRVLSALHRLTQARCFGRRSEEVLLGRDANGAGLRLAAARRRRSRRGRRATRPPSSTSAG